MRVPQMRAADEVISHKRGYTWITAWRGCVPRTGMRSAANGMWSDAFAVKSGMGWQTWKRRFAVLAVEQ